MFFFVKNDTNIELTFVSICLVVQSALASFNQVQQCIELCNMGQEHIDECCAAYGYHQNGYCTKLFGKQVRCEIKDRRYLVGVPAS